MEQQRHDQTVVVAQAEQFDQVAPPTALRHQVIQKGRYSISSLRNATGIPSDKGTGASPKT
jgi:hypothetical protein